MTWRKIGFFEIPQGRSSWMYSHCQLPTAMPLDNRRVRVFFASRTQQQRSHIGFVDLAFSANRKSFSVERVSDAPVLSPGPIGFFDEHGVYPSSVVCHEGRHYMFFIGWNQGVEPPLFYASIGLATSEDGLNFQRSSRAPVMARSEFDPCLVTSPHVYLENGLWRMTYVSGIKWTRNEQGRLVSHYHIKYAESRSPCEWKSGGQVAIDLIAGETNIARSSVLKVSENDYRVWYSYVHLDVGKYRIGYAESTDGKVWQRKDHLAGITLDGDFAKEMICYPCVFRLGDHFFMLYNGDDFGKAGFGVARLDQTIF